LRATIFIGVLSACPTIALAQQPCTTDARLVVNELYRHMLERSADSGSAAWVDKLTSGSMTVKDVVREVAKSPEHLQRFGNEPREQTVGTLYRHILGRQADEEGRRNFANMAGTRGLGAVVDDIVNSSEYQQSFGDWGVPGSGGVNYCGRSAQTSQNQQFGNNGNGRGRGNAMRFRRLDTNNDGMISRGEWRGDPQVFDQRDWNRDGMLSGDEVRVGSTPPANSVAAQNYDASTPDRFDYLDVNGNGTIDRNEWDGGYEAFTVLDTNKDGRLTQPEFGRSNSAQSSNFASLDRNRDGRLTLTEWPWSHRAFDQQDTNGDGTITQSEFRGNGAVATSGRQF